MKIKNAAEAKEKGSIGCGPLENKMKIKISKKDGDHRQLELGAGFEGAGGLLVCGCDEVGRGAGAGELYAGAVILEPSRPIAGLADSKKLSARRREELSEEIKLRALAWRIETASLEEIDRLNVLHASLLAMERAVRGLKVRPARVFVDGNKKPKLPDFQVIAIVGGDASVAAISAASILAKVARDQVMVECHALYPQYGFDVHKGYLTKMHMEALRKYGPCPLHRKTYAPIRELIEPSGGQTGLF